MSFIPIFCPNHLLRKISYRILMTRIKSQITQNNIYNITKSICFNLNELSLFIVIKDWYFDKRSFQLSKSLPSSGNLESGVFGL